MGQLDQQTPRRHPRRAERGGPTATSRLFLLDCRSTVPYVSHARTMTHYGWSQDRHFYEIECMPYHNPLAAHVLMRSSFRAAA